MPRYGTTGRIAVYWVPTIASMAAPTTTEIIAGTNLTPYMLRDGLKTPATGNTIDAADAASRFNSTAPGTYGGDAGSYMGHRGTKTADDVAWTTLQKDSIGFLVVARQGFNQNATTGLGSPTGAPTLADKCEVYSAAVISRAMEDIAENQTSRFSANIAFTGEPVQDAVVAAGS